MKLIHIKWENILCLIFGTFYIIKLTTHIVKYGFDFESDMAIFVICSVLLLLVYVITLSLRRTLIEMEDIKDENN